jgi:hypothetical protein
LDLLPTDQVRRDHAIGLMRVAAATGTMAYDQPGNLAGRRFVVASNFGTGQVFLSMLWFFLFFIWIWLLISVFGDILRSPDLGGLAKALWTIFVIVVPYFGVFVYLIARGGKMHEHAAQAAAAQDAAMKDYIRDAVKDTTPSP